jgi:ADP-ribose pyrophosphatase
VRIVVVHPGSVAVVAVDKQRRLVFVEQYREPAQKKLLEIPAGVREEGESALETAQRELKEECGLHGGDWEQVAHAWTTPGFVREEMTLFIATDLEEGEDDPDDGEDVRVVRRPVDELPQLIAETEDLKTLAGLLLYQARQESNTT